jgi:hypothetical protein
LKKLRPNHFGDIFQKKMRPNGKISPNLVTLPVSLEADFLR